MSFYEVVGTITGNYATPIIVRLHNFKTGELISELEVFTGEYKLPAGDILVECYVTFLPNIGTLWSARHFYSVDDLVYPSTDSGVFYYFKCIEPGNSGNIEPVFSADPLKRFSDGDCTWLRVEGLPPPHMVYPVTPTVAI